MSEELEQRVKQLEAELASLREVADPDNEYPELSTRDCIMHLGEQASFLEGMVKLAGEYRQQRENYKKKMQYFESECNRLKKEYEGCADY